MTWLKRNAEPLEAIAALVTAGVALAALVAIPLQIRANAELQSAQSARDIYREFVALSINKPTLAHPNYCAMKDEGGASLTAYSFYIEYLLYTAEQVTSVSGDWVPVMQSHIAEHQEFLCDNSEWHSDEGPVKALVAAARAQCSKEMVC